MRDIHVSSFLHIVASAPKVVIQEWIEGVPMSVIIREGTTEQRDLMGTRLFELTYDAPRRLEMMHGDAHPGNFMLLPNDKMGVVDFGAVAPMPGGIPIEIGMATRFALNDDYNNLLTAMQAIGFVQKGEQVSKREMDEMMKAIVEPLEVEVFHYTRKWLQRITAMNVKPTVQQARSRLRVEMNMRPSVGDPDQGDRLQRRDLLPARRAHSRQTACHRSCGTRRTSSLTDCTTAPTATRENPAAPTRPPGFLLGVLAWPSRRGRLRAMTVPRSRISPPQTPAGSRAAARRPGTHRDESAIRAQRLGAFVRQGIRRTTYRDPPDDTAPPASSFLGMSPIGALRASAHRS